MQANPPARPWAIHPIFPIPNDPSTTEAHEYERCNTLMLMAEIYAPGAPPTRQECVDACIHAQRYWAARHHCGTPADARRVTVELLHLAQAGGQSAESRLKFIDDTTSHVYHAPHHHTILYGAFRNLGALIDASPDEVTLSQEECAALAAPR